MMEVFLSQERRDEMTVIELSWIPPNYLQENIEEGVNQEDEEI
jgi:hypothetical protein